MTELSNEMELAAGEAAKELRKDMTGAEVAAWMKQHYLKAGYKRLSKLLIAFFA